MSKSVSRLVWETSPSDSPVGSTPGRAGRPTPIRHKQFVTSEDDISLFSNLVSPLKNAIDSFSDHVEFVDHPMELIDNLGHFVDSHAFDGSISGADIRQLAHCFVNGTAVIEIRSRYEVSMDAVKCFLKWIMESDAQMQKRIIENVIAKLETIPIIQPLPF